MIYIFDLPEFQVLAAAKGMERYYGFPAVGEMSKEQVFFSVYQLTKSGILKQEDDGLVIQPPVARYMDVVSAANLVTVADSGQYRLPRQCIYVCSSMPGDELSNGEPSGGEPSDRDLSGMEISATDKRYICLENSRTDPGSICLSGLEEEELFLQLQDLGQLPPEHLTEDIGTYDFDGYWDSHMPPELWERLKEGLELETEELLETEPVHSVFTLRNKECGQMRARMVLLDFALEYCMVLQTPDGMQLCRYNREEVRRILEIWWRNEL